MYMIQEIGHETLEISNVIIEIHLPVRKGGDWDGSERKCGHQGRSIAVAADRSGVRVVKT